MPRSGSPERDRAFAIFRDNGGKIANREIANQLRIPEKTVSGWKVKDQWLVQLNGVLQTNEQSTPNRNGSPHVNNNAAGNVGGPGGPARNNKTLKIGEHETIWLDVLEDDERGLVGRIQTGPMDQLNDEITLLTIRERRMLQRIQQLIGGLSEKQRRVLQERQSTKEAVPVYGDDGSSKGTIVQPRGPYHWFKLEFIDKAKEKHILHLHFTMDDNLSLSEKVKVRFRRTFSGVFFKRFILGLWGGAEGAIYDMWDEVCPLT